MIESVQTYEDEWVQWWTKAQPDWRSVETWLFPKDDPGTEDWGSLFSSGKDGLYIVVMSLSWWAHALDPAVDSKIYDAVSDVSWVMEQLIISLTDDDTFLDSSPSTSPSPPPTKRRQSFKVGPPKKRRNVKE